MVSVSKRNVSILRHVETSTFPIVKYLLDIKTTLHSSHNLMSNLGFQELREKFPRIIQ